MSSFLADLKATVRVDTAELRKAEQDARAFTNNLRQSGDALGPLDTRMRSLGSATRELGPSMSRYVTLPILAAGAAAAKLAIDFDQSFSRMQGLAGVSADEIDGLKQSVLDLAGATGRGPQELAEGLYFIRSAGLAGRAALEALEVSAKAAAAGMGSTQDVANALTSALGVYGEVNLSAAEAGDVLVATVRAGKAEASEMAGQLGKITPVAKTLGVEFDEVGGALAFLTVSMGSTEQAATGLTSLFRNLVAPGAEARDALQSIGLTVTELRAAIADDGLVAGMELLGDAVGENDRLLKQIIPDAEGFNAALQILNDTSGRFGSTMAGVADHAGALDVAFDAAAESDAFKLQQAMANLQGAAIELGHALAPVLTAFAEVASTGAAAFSALPGGAQAMIIFAGAALAATGPLLSLVDNVKRLQTALAGVNTQSALGGLTGFLGRYAGTAGAAAGLAALAFSLDDITEALHGMTRAEPNLQAVAEGLAQLAEGGTITAETARAMTVDLSELGDNINRVFDQSFYDKFNSFGGMSEKVSDARREIELIDQTLAALVTSGHVQTAADSFDKLRTSLLAEGIADDDITAAFDDYAAALATVDSSADVAASSLSDAEREAQATAQAFRLVGDEFAGIAGMGTSSDVAAFFAELPGPLERAAEAASDLNAELSALLDRAFGVQDATDAIADAVARFAESVKENGNQLDEQNEAGREQRQIVQDVVRADGELVTAYVNEGHAAAEVTRFTNEHVVALSNQLQAMGLAKADADLLALSLTGIRDEVTTTFDTPGADEAAEKADAVDAATRRVPTRWTTEMGTAGHSAAVANANDVETNVRAIPTRWHAELGTAGHSAAVAQANGVTASVRNIPTSWRTHLTADAGNVWAGAMSARAALASIPSVKVVTVAFNTLGSIPAMAHGGRVDAGQVYMVNEQRPEFFVPDVPGRVYAHRESGIAMARHEGLLGGEVKVEQTFNVAGDMDAYTRALIRATAGEAAEKTARAIAERGSTRGL